MAKAKEAVVEDETMQDEPAPAAAQPRLTVETIRDPRWTNAEGTQLSAFVKFAEHPEELDFSAHDGSGESWMQEVWDRCTAEEFGPVAAYVAPPPPVTVIPVDTFFARTTEIEAEEIDAEMQTKPIKHRRAYNAPTPFRLDTELWPVLRGVIVDLYGEARADELLAPA